MAAVKQLVAGVGRKLTPKTNILDEKPVTVVRGRDVVDGDPLARLADALGVDAEALARLKQGDQPLDSVYESKYMFN